MNLLLDTHTLLWFITDDPRLSEAADQLIEDQSNNKFVSAVSVWEIAIKVSLDKIMLTAPFDELFPKQLHINGFELLPVKVEHTSALTNLPFHHRDPFDRMLTAQSLVENKAIVSIDRAFDDYGVPRLW